MPTPARIVALLIIGASICLPIRSQAQSANKDTAATISGKVTIKGKAAAGIVVGMRLSRPEQFSTTYKARTDQEGVYHITKVAAGSYFVSPVAPALVVVGSAVNSQGQSVIVGEGESVDGINFDLIPGGVVTGKVTDSDGHPLIEERVTLTAADETNQRRAFISNGMTTDDRGVYRIFGVPAGRYKVSVGDSRFSPGMNRRPVVSPTFYPDVTDVAKAGIVEVTEGSEANKIDITVGETPQGYSVSGRVVDGESGAPATNVVMILSRIEILGASSTRSDSQYLDVRSDVQGQFKLTNVIPGKYEVNFSPPEDSDFRAEAPVRFDVIDQDVSGLVIKTIRGATIAGTVVFEGGKNNPTQTPSQMWIMVLTRSEDNNRSISSSGSVRVKPDGTFFAGGLSAGTVTLNVETPMNNRGFTLSRVERNGVLQPNGIQISNGEHINGVRLVMTVSSGTVRGIVRVENGTLPATGRIFVQISKEGDQMPLPRATEVDARGHFLIEGLAAGSYELSAMAYAPEWQRRRPPISAKQIVTVTEGGATDVTLTLDLTPPPNQ